MLQCFKEIQMYRKQIKGHFTHRGILLFFAYCHFFSDFPKVSATKKHNFHLHGQILIFLNVFFYKSLSVLFLITSQTESMVYCNFFFCILVSFSLAYYTFACVHRCECLLICGSALAGGKWSPTEVVSDV